MSKGTKTIETGINGRGDTVWIVVTERTGEAGRIVRHAETFDTKAEAEAWVRWA